MYQENYEANFEIYTFRQMADSNIVTSLAGHLFNGGALFQNRQFGDLFRSLSSIGF